MQRTIRHGAWCTVALLLCAAPAGAQQTNPKWAVDMFDKPEHDFGVVAKGADVRYRLKVTNKYGQPIHIASVGTSCGCASAKAPAQTTLASNESAYIEVAMDTLRHEHQKNSNVVVVFDSPYHVEVRIPIKAYIRTDVVLTPGGAEFGPVSKGSEQQRKIAIQYAGRENWTIKDVINKNSNFDVKLTETGRGGGRAHYELLVSLKAGAPIGDFRNQLTLVTDDASNPYIPVLVDGRVEPEFIIQDVVSFGILAPGEKKTINVVVRGKKPFAIDKIESEKSAGTFEVRLPIEPRAVHVLPLTIIAPKEPGTVEELFTVTINGIPEPVQFRAYGKITMPQAAPNAN